MKQCEHWEIEYFSPRGPWEVMVCLDCFKVLGVFGSPKKPSDPDGLRRDAVYLAMEESSRRREECRKSGKKHLRESLSI